MGSAHRLVEKNICVKINGNVSKDSGDMERERNLRINPMVLKCDIGIESA